MTASGGTGSPVLRLAGFCAAVLLAADCATEEDERARASPETPAPQEAYWIRRLAEAGDEAEAALAAGKLAELGSTRAFSPILDAWLASARGQRARALLLLLRGVGDTAETSASAAGTSREHAGARAAAGESPRPTRCSCPTSS
jgi:hypothetical protein